MSFHLNTVEGVIYTLKPGKFSINSRFPIHALLINSLTLYTVDLQYI